MARRRTVEIERIRQAAAELLAGSSPETVTIAAVAGAAGVSTGTVYNYFRNKEHLLAAAAGVPGALSAWVDPPDGQAPGEHLRQLARQALERFRLLAGPGQDAAETLAAEVDWLGGRLAAILPRGRRKDPRVTARVFYGALAGAVLLGWKREDDGPFASTLAALLASDDA